MIRNLQKLNQTSDSFFMLCNIFSAVGFNNNKQIHQNSNFKKKVVKCSVIFIEKQEFTEKSIQPSECFLIILLFSISPFFQKIMNKTS